MAARGGGRDRFIRPATEWVAGPQPGETPLSLKSSQVPPSSASLPAAPGCKTPPPQPFLRGGGPGTRQHFAPRVSLYAARVPIPGTLSPASGTWRSFWEGKSRNRERVQCEAAGAPKPAAGRCGLSVSRRVSGRSSGFGQKGKKRKTSHFSLPLFVSLFPPSAPSSACPPQPPTQPPKKPTFSMTSFDEILQHRNLQPSSAQDFFVFWQHPLPAMQIGSSDSKLRALPLRHNRFPQRSLKYLRVFISLLRDG